MIQTMRTRGQAPRCGAWPPDLVLAPDMRGRGSTTPAVSTAARSVAEDKYV